MKPVNSTNRKRSRVDYQRLEARQLLSANLPDSMLSQLASSAESAYLLQNENGLQLISDRTGATGSTTLVQQTKHGIPIHHAYLTVDQSLDGTIVDVNGTAIQDLATEADRVPAIDVTLAEELALTQLDLTDQVAGQASNSSELVWNESGQLAWQVSTYLNDPQLEQTADYYSIIDAHTGDVLSQGTPTGVHQLLYNPDTETGVHSRIVINDATGPAGSQAYADPFDAVVALPGCTGTLVAPNVVLSARHCQSSVGNNIRFGEDSSNPIFNATVSNVIVPAGTGTLLDGGDFNILILASDVPSSVATPMKLIDVTTGLEGMVAATVGYGLNGVGSTGHQGTADGLRWGGENIIDVYGTPASQGGSNIFSTDFDDGTAGANTIPAGDPNPLPFEATTAPGDSGGPLMVQYGTEWVIAGVLSGGTTSTSVYGDISWWTGVQPFRTQIEAVGGVFVEGTVDLNQDTYFIGETATITVEDPFASSPTVDVTLVSASGDIESVTLTGSGSTYTGTIDIASGNVVNFDGILQVSFSDDITVTYGVSAIDTAVVESITGTDGDDIIVVDIGPEVILTVNGTPFQIAAARGSLAFDAMGGNDQITVLTGPGDDVATIANHALSINGLFDFDATNVETVELFNRGGSDTVNIHGTLGDEFFESFGNRSLLTGSGFSYGVRNYLMTNVNGMGGNDEARLFGSPGNDRLMANAVTTMFDRTDLDVRVEGFGTINAFAGGGDHNLGRIVGTPGNDTVRANNEYLNVSGPGMLFNARGFARVDVEGNGGENIAYLSDTSGTDLFFSAPGMAYMSGANFFNYVSGYGQVFGYSGGETGDRAIMNDSPGNDQLYATPDFATLSGLDYRSRANGFAQVTVLATAGENVATLADSSGDDVFIAESEFAFMKGNGFLNYTRNFDRVAGLSTLGFDKAILRGSAGGSNFRGSFRLGTLTGLTGNQFVNSASNFDRLTVTAHPVGISTAEVFDSPEDDTFVGNGADATLFNSQFVLRTSGFNRVIARKVDTGMDRLFANNIDYDLTVFGEWN